MARFDLGRKKDDDGKGNSASSSSARSSSSSSGSSSPLSSSGQPKPNGLSASGAPPLLPDSAAGRRQGSDGIDLERRRDQLNARVAELQFDLGGLVYEMAIRDRIRVDVLVQRAAVLQDADAELGEVERILRLEQTSTAGACRTCGAPHSAGAAFCWQCGQPILAQVGHDTIQG